MENERTKQTLPEGAMAWSHTLLNKARDAVGVVLELSCLWKDEPVTVGSRLSDHQSLVCEVLYNRAEQCAGKGKQGLFNQSAHVWKRGNSWENAGCEGRRAKFVREVISRRANRAGNTKRTSAAALAQSDEICLSSPSISSHRLSSLSLPPFFFFFSFSPWSEQCIPSVLFLRPCPLPL